MRVAIIGTMQDSRGLAPYNDPEWEIWGCSPGNAYGALPRVTRWFELHGVVDLKGPENADWNAKYFEWLAAQTFPVYMQEPNDLLPQCRIFPRMAWLKEFGDWGRMAATSSIALMVGFAIMEGADEIGIWGVDMQADVEIYSLQKAGCQIMLKLAHERGIKTTVPLESCLSTMPPFYGYDLASRMGRKLYVRKLVLEQQAANAQAQMNHQERVLYQTRGALEMVNYMLRTWVNGVEDAEIDVEETFGEVAGKPASVVHPKGTSIQFGDVRPLNGGGDPSKMDFVERGGLFVPKPGVNMESPAE